MGSTAALLGSFLIGNTAAVQAHTSLDKACVCIEINFEQKWHFLIKFKQLKFIHDNQGSSVIISEQVL